MGYETPECSDFRWWSCWWRADNPIKDYWTDESGVLGVVLIGSSKYRLDDNC
jgi:hypothetical protein